MSISGVSSTAASSIASWSSQQNTVQQTFNQLMQAVQSGNLANARQAYATLMQSVPGSSSPSTASNGANNPFASALQQIGQALQSGNISSAQSVLSALRTQMQGAHHHHHHRGGMGGAGSAAGSNANSANASATSATLSTSALAGILPGTSGGTTNILA